MPETHARVRPAYTEAEDLPYWSPESGSNAGKIGSRSGSMRGFGSKLKFAKGQLKALFSAPAPPPQIPATLSQNDPVDNNRHTSARQFLESSQVYSPSEKHTKKHKNLRQLLGAGSSKRFDDATDEVSKKKPYRSKYIEEGELEQAEAEALAKERGERRNAGCVKPPTCNTMPSHGSHRKAAPTAWAEKKEPKASSSASSRTQVQFLGNSDRAQDLIARGKKKLEAGDGHGAVELLEEALKLQQDLHGRDSEETLLATACLGIGHEMAGRNADAKALKKKVLAVSLKCYGRKHRETLTARANLATSYSDLGRHDKALKEHQDVLAARQEVLGPQHPDTLLAMHNVGRELCLVGDYVEGQWMLAECLEQRRAAKGVRHLDTIVTMHWLAKVLLAMHRFNEAESLLVECLEHVREEYGAGHPSTVAVEQQRERCRAKLDEADAASLPPKPPCTPAVATRTAMAARTQSLPSRRGDLQSRMSTTSLSGFLNSRKKWQEEVKAFETAAPTSQQRRRDGDAGRLFMPPSEVRLAGGQRGDAPKKAASAMEVRALVAEHEEELQREQDRQKAEKAEAEKAEEGGDDAQELRNAEAALAALAERRSRSEAEAERESKDKALAPEEREAAAARHREEMRRMDREEGQPMRERAAELRAALQARREQRRKQVEKGHRKALAELRRAQQEALQALQEQHAARVVADASSEEAAQRHPAAERATSDPHPLAPAAEEEAAARQPADAAVEGGKQGKAERLKLRGRKTLLAKVPDAPSEAFLSEV